MTIVFHIEADWQVFTCIVPERLRMRSLAGLSSVFLRAGAHGKTMQLATVLDKLPNQERVTWQFQDLSVRCETFDESSLDPPTVSWESHVVEEFGITADVFSPSGAGIEHGHQELKGTYNHDLRASGPLTVDLAVSYVKSYALRFWNHNVLMVETLPQAHIYLGVSEDLGPDRGIGVNLELKTGELVFEKNDLNQWLAALKKGVQTWIWGLFPPVDDGLVHVTAWMKEVTDEAALAVVRIEVDVNNRANGTSPVLAMDTVAATGAGLKDKHYVRNGDGDLEVTISENFPKKTKTAAAKQFKALTVWNVHRERPHRVVRMLRAGAESVLLVRSGSGSSFPDHIADLLGVPVRRHMDVAARPYDVPALSPFGEDLLVVVAIDSASCASGSMFTNVTYWSRVLNDLLKEIGSQSSYHRRAVLIFETNDTANVATAVARGIGWDVLDCIGPAGKIETLLAPANAPIAVPAGSGAVDVDLLVDWSQKVASAEEFLPDADERKRRLPDDLQGQQHKAWHFLPSRAPFAKLTTSASSPAGSSVQVLEEVDNERVLAGGVVRSEVLQVVALVEDLLLASSPQTTLVTVRAAMRSAGSTVSANQIASVYAAKHTETLVLSPVPSTVLEETRLVYDDIATAFDQSHYTSALFVTESSAAGDSNPAADALRWAFANHAPNKSVVIVIVAGPQYTGRVDVELSATLARDDVPLFHAFLLDVFPRSQEALDKWIGDALQAKPDETGGAGLQVLHLFQPVLASFTEMYPVIEGVVDSVYEKVGESRARSALVGLAFSSVFDGNLPADRELPGAIKDLVARLGRQAKCVLVWKRVRGGGYALVLAHRAVAWAIIARNEGDRDFGEIGHFPDLVAFKETWGDYTTLLRDVGEEEIVFAVLKNVFQATNMDDQTTDSARASLLLRGLLGGGLNDAVTTVAGLSAHPALSGNTTLRELWKIHRNLAVSKLLRFCSRKAFYGGRKKDALKLYHRALKYSSVCVDDMADMLAENANDRRVLNTYLTSLMEAVLAAEYAGELDQAKEFLDRNLEAQPEPSQPREIAWTESVLSRRVEGKLAAMPAANEWQTVTGKKKRRKNRRGQR